MFAFALWDSRAERLLLARDRAGKKPLYLPPAPGRRRRLRVGGARARPRLSRTCRSYPNLEAIDEYLTLQYVPSPLTAYRDIWKLQAAHLAVARAGQADSRRERYWTKPRGPELAGDARRISRASSVDLLEKAVQRRLVADVPLGRVPLGRARQLDHRGAHGDADRAGR